MNTFADLPRPFFVLAPMDDVTDTVFRQVVADCAAPEIFFTEFVNVDGLQSPGRTRVLKKLRMTAAEQPLVAQIWGKSPDNFYKTAQEIADGTIARELGLPEGVNFAGIDLNMGCPDKTVVKNGTCSALINNRELASALIKATQMGARSGAQSSGRSELPVSVKTRLGFNVVDLSWHEFLLGHDLAMLTVHGRTRKEMSKVPAHWELIGQVRELRDKLAPQTLLVGNGDVESRQQGIALAKQYNLDGIMIGRGIFHDPYAFAASSPWQTLTPLQRLALYRRQVELFAATWQHDERRIFTLNKFCKIYINGFDGSKELREELMAAQSATELLTMLDHIEKQLVASATPAEQIAA